MDLARRCYKFAMYRQLLLPLKPLTSAVNHKLQLQQSEWEYKIAYRIRIVRNFTLMHECNVQVHYLTRTNYTYTIQTIIYVFQHVLVVTQTRNKFISQVLESRKHVSNSFTQNKFLVCTHKCTQFSFIPTCRRRAPVP